MCCSALLLEPWQNMSVNVRMERMAISPRRTVRYMMYTPENPPPFWQPSKEKFCRCLGIPHTEGSVYYAYISKTVTFIFMDTSEKEKGGVLTLKHGQLVSYDLLHHLCQPDNNSSLQLQSKSELLYRMIRVPTDFRGDIPKYSVWDTKTKVMWQRMPGSQLRTVPAYSEMSNIRVWTISWKHFENA